MKSYLKADFAFTPSWMRVVKPLFPAVAIILAIVFISSEKAAFAISLLYGALLLLSEAIFEYSKYLGIGSPKQSSMSMIRSSACGVATVKSALYGDTILSALKSILIVGIPTYLCLKSSASEMSAFADKPFLLIAIASTVLIYAFLMLNKLISRRLLLTLQTYMIVEMLILWGLDSIYCSIVFAMIAPDFQELNANAVAISVIAISVILGFIFTRLNINKTISGFIAGYRDSEVIND